MMKPTICDGRALVLVIICVPGWGAETTADVLGPHKCVSGDGHVTYQDEPCERLEEQKAKKASINIYSSNHVDTATKTRRASSMKPRTRNVRAVNKRTLECADARKAEARITRGAYGNDAGGMSAKLRARASAIRRRMALCR